MLQTLKLSLLLIAQSLALQSGSPRVCSNEICYYGTTIVSYTNVSIDCFMGIPYASPPIGHLRFQDPEAPSSKVISVNAKVPPPQCAQLDFRHENQFRGEEDCLYLNVYKKSGAFPARRVSSRK